MGYACSRGSGILICTHHSQEGYNSCAKMPGSGSELWVAPEPLSPSVPNLEYGESN